MDGLVPDIHHGMFDESYKKRSNCWRQHRYVVLRRINGVFVFVGGGVVGRIKLGNFNFLSELLVVHSL